MAGRFHFSLQRILNLREMIEETKAVKLKNSQTHLKEEELRLAVMEHRKSAYLDEIQEQDVSGGQVSVIDLQVSRSYINQMNWGIKNQNKTIAESEKKVEQDRQEVLQAARDKMILEKLKERKKEEFLVETRKKTIKDESEIAARIQRQNEAGGMIE